MHLACRLILQRTPPTKSSPSKVFKVLDQPKSLSPRAVATVREAPHRRAQRRPLHRLLQAVTRPHQEFQHRQARSPRLLSLQRPSLRPPTLQLLARIRSLRLLPLHQLPLHRFLLQLFPRLTHLLLRLQRHPNHAKCLSRSLRRQLPSQVKSAMLNTLRCS
jgi:hypothetical protein